MFVTDFETYIDPATSLGNPRLRSARFNYYLNGCFMGYKDGFVITKDFPKKIESIFIW